MAAPCFWRVSGRRISNKKIIYLTNVALLHVNFLNLLIFQKLDFYTVLKGREMSFLLCCRLSFKQLPALGKLQSLWLND